MFLLDSVTPDQIRQWRRRHEDILDYYWEYYSCLAQQRARVVDDLKHSLRTEASGFSFDKWVRIVGYAQATDPLSAAGSIAASGGRFNIGDIDRLKFPRFPALYLANDFPTAYRERYGIDQPDEADGLTSSELALAARGSLTCVSVEGQWQQVLDIRSSATLEQFVARTREFHVTKWLRDRARVLGLPAPGVTPTADVLWESILDPEWRRYPAMLEVPSNSQIVGQLAREAAVEAIVYPSARSGGLCMAVFPDRVILDGSYVQLKGERPAEVTNWRLDASTRGNFSVFRE
jgi:hypothetical protein